MGSPMMRDYAVYVFKYVSEYEETSTNGYGETVKLGTWKSMEQLFTVVANMDEIAHSIWERHTKFQTNVKLLSMTKGKIDHVVIDFGQ